MGIYKKIKQFIKDFSTRNLTTWQQLGGYTPSGLRNNLDAYRSSLYVYACISKIAEKCASIELDLNMIKNGRGDTKEVFNHPVIDLLYKPNSRQTKVEFFETTIINMLLGGQAFWYLFKDGNNLTEVRNIRPDYMELIYDKTGALIGFEFNDDKGFKHRIEKDLIVHFKFANPFNSDIGFSPIIPIRTRVETEVSGIKMQKETFDRDGQPKAFLKLPGSATTQQKNELREEFETRFSGRNRDSNIAVLEGGITYERASMGPKEMDYIESLKLTRDDILVAFKVPKPIIAITEDVNYANAKTAVSIFLSETIKPLFTRIVEKINEELIANHYDPRLFFSFEDPTPENRTELITEYTLGVNNGLYMLNEARQWLGLPPVISGWTRYIPMGMQAVGGLKQDSEQKDIQDGILRANEKIEHDIYKKNIKRLYGKEKLKQVFASVEEIQDTVKKGLKEKVLKTLNEKHFKEYSALSKFQDEEKRLSYFNAVNKKLDDRAEPFLNEIQNYFKGLEQRVLDKTKSIKRFHKGINAKRLLNAQKEIGLFAEMSLPFIEEFVKNSLDENLSVLNPAEDPTITASIKEAIKKRSEFLANSVISTTIDQILLVVETGNNEGLSNNEIADEIQVLFADISDGRSAVIARTETTFANNYGTLNAYKQSGVATHKEWIATPDDRTRDEHLAMNGEIVEIDKNFSNGLDFPQEPNCRCVIAPAFKE